MRRSFERNLDSLKPMAQDQAEGEWTDEDQAELDRVIEYHLEKSAASQNTAVDTQRQIFDLQVEKQKIMSRLKEEIRQLDNPEVQHEVQPGERHIIGRDGALIWRSGRNEHRTKSRSKKITAGEILTDASWGIPYSLDPATVPRNLRKRYCIERAKQEILDLLNLQILRQETTRGASEPSSRLAAYAATLKHIESGTREQLRGMIAERMVKNFLKKLMIDHGLDIIIEDADVHQDVEFKVDFILRRRQHVRGVGVETHEDEAHPNKTVGIQFTINTSSGNLAKKQKMIDRKLRQLQSGSEDTSESIEDLILVSLPEDKVLPIFQHWEHSQHTSGGPDQFWNLGVRESLFRGVLKGVFTPEELDERWEKISSTK